MRRQARHALVAAAAWACAVALLALALSAGTSPRPASAAPVALSAFWPGDDYSTDLQDDQQVAPLEDPSMPSGEGEYIAMGDGEDDDAIQTGGDNPAMQHVATGRVFDVQRQVQLPSLAHPRTCAHGDPSCSIFTLTLPSRCSAFVWSVPMFELPPWAAYCCGKEVTPGLSLAGQGALDPEHTKHRNYEFPVF
jgi:hypothetical protein